MIDCLLVIDKWAILRLYSCRGQFNNKYTRNKSGNRMNYVILLHLQKKIWDILWTCVLKVVTKTTRSISKVVRGLQLVEHEPLTIPRHLSSTPFELGSFCISLVFSVVFCPFCLFLLVIALTVLQITASDYPFSIFKRFSVKQHSTCSISLQSDTTC